MNWHAGTLVVILLWVVGYRGHCDGSDEEQTCVFAGLFGNQHLYLASDCRPKECVRKNPVEGFHCRIGNYDDQMPGACKRVETDLRAKDWHPPPPAEDVCHPLLTAISLYDFKCPQLQNKVEKALRFKWILPLCNPTFIRNSQGLKVDFNADGTLRKAHENYFVSHQICRTFNYSLSDFSDRTNLSTQIELEDRCMAIGLQDDYPDVLYYISLTEFPTGVQVNYSTMFKDVKEDSMQLLAGAWLTRRTAHFIFQPIKGIRTYRIEAKSESKRWRFSKEISTPSVKIVGIPNSTNTVTATVTPNDREACERLNYYCSPITLTLIDKNTLNLPADPSGPPEEEEPSGGTWKIYVVIGAGIVLAGALLTIAVFLFRHLLRAQPGNGPLSEARRSLLWISDPSFTWSPKVEAFLKKKGFIVRPAVDDDSNPVELMRQFNIMILVVASSVNVSERYTRFIKILLENKPLWKKLRVISFAEKGQVFLPPSEVVMREMFKNYSCFGDFLHHLDKNVYRMPHEREKLVKNLKECGAGVQRQSVLYRRNSQMSFLTTEADETESCFSELAPSIAVSYISESELSEVSGHRGRPRIPPTSMGRYDAVLEEDEHGVDVDSLSGASPHMSNVFPEAHVCGHEQHIVHDHADEGNQQSQSLLLRPREGRGAHEHWGISEQRVCSRGPQTCMVQDQLYQAVPEEDECGADDGSSPQQLPDAEASQHIPFTETLPGVHVRDQEQAEMLTSQDNYTDDSNQRQSRSLVPRSDGSHCGNESMGAEEEAVSEQAAHTHSPSADIHETHRKLVMGQGQEASDNAEGFISRHQSSDGDSPETSRKQVVEADPNSRDSGVNMRSSEDTQRKCVFETSHDEVVDQKVSPPCVEIRDGVPLSGIIHEKHLTSSLDSHSGVISSGGHATEAFSDLPLQQRREAVQVSDEEEGDGNAFQEDENSIRPQLQLSEQEDAQVFENHRTHDLRKETSEPDEYDAARSGDFFLGGTEKGPFTESGRSPNIKSPMGCIPNLLLELEGSSHAENLRHRGPQGEVEPFVNPHYDGEVDAEGRRRFMPGFDHHQPGSEVISCDRSSSSPSSPLAISSSSAHYRSSLSSSTPHTEQSPVCRPPPPLPAPRFALSPSYHQRFDAARNFEPNRNANLRPSAVNSRANSSSNAYVSVNPTPPIPSNRSQISPCNPSLHPLGSGIQHQPSDPSPRPSGSGRRHLPVNLAQHPRNNPAPNLPYNPAHLPPGALGAHPAAAVSHNQGHLPPGALGAHPAAAVLHNPRHLPPGALGAHPAAAVPHNPGHLPPGALGAHPAAAVPHNPRHLPPGALGAHPAAAVPHNPGHLPPGALGAHPAAAVPHNPGHLPPGALGAHPAAAVPHNPGHLPPGALGAHPAAAVPHNQGHLPPGALGAHPAAAVPHNQGHLPPGALGAHPAAAVPHNPGHLPPGALGAHPAAAVPHNQGHLPPGALGAHPAAAVPWANQRQPVEDEWRPQDDESGFFSAE